MVNQTSVTEFSLLEFSDVRELQILHFVGFLFIYLIALIGNTLLLVTVMLNRTLHSPMYFFLANLSIIDACFVSTTMPKSMANSLMHDKLISFYGCVMQVFWVAICASGELSLLTVMAYDRFVAICRPLHYTLIMNRNACFKMAAASWVCSIINSLVHTVNTFRLDFCRSNVIEQFFCDTAQLLALSCTDSLVNICFLFILSSTLGTFILVFILVSYGYIFSTVLKIPSAQARYKAFSTCVPHLTVFALFLCTCAFSVLRPKALSSPVMDLLAAVLYTVLPPLMNPIIYSLRNKEIQKALWTMSKKMFKFHSHNLLQKGHMI